MQHCPPPPLRQVLAQTSVPGAEADVVIPKGHNRVLLHMQSPSGSGWNVGALVVYRRLQNPFDAAKPLRVMLESVPAPVNARGWQRLYDVEPDGLNMEVTFGGGFTPTDMIILCTSWAEGL